jgi:hypothetical protein
VHPWFYLETTEGFMMQEQNVKKGRNISFSKVIGVAIVALLIGTLLGSFLGIMVIQPELEKLHISFGDQGNRDGGNQNGDGNGNQGTIINNNPTPSNPTGSYGGTSQFDLTMTKSGNTFSGSVTANTNCHVQQTGNNIQLSFDFTPTQVSGNLQQAISTDNDVVFNFVGTSSGTQFNANAKGTAGSGNNGFSFDISISGTIEQNQLSFSITSASNAQLKVSTQQDITLYNNA